MIAPATTTVLPTKTVGNKVIAEKAFCAAESKPAARMHSELFKCVQSWKA